MTDESSSAWPMASEPPPAFGKAAVDWKYEMRREAQMIVPHLYLGPFQSSIKLEKMKALGITHVLCIRDQKEARLIFPRFPQAFVYMTLDISDNIDQNLITILPSCLRFIRDALSQGGTVLAHCNGGIALSPAIVVGYLMSRYNWTYENSLAFVQSKRYCVSPASFQVQLQEFEPIYLAQKSIDLQLAVGMTRKGGMKRGVDDDHDDEDEDYSRRQPSRPDGGTGDAMQL